MMKCNWLVYILECSDGSYYTGITNNLEQRVITHSKGKGSKYVRGKLPVKVVWTSENYNHSQSAKLECKIKRLSHREKILLISEEVSKQWQQLKEL